MHTQPDKHLATRARAARHAIRHDHVNPQLALSYVVWPTHRLEHAQQQRQAA